MTNTLHETFSTISFDPGANLGLQPLPGDPWVASSALQKAIRRGEAETAERAAISLLRYRGAGLFRRLIVIAFEDIGIGSPELVAAVTRLCSDTKFRRTVGEPEVVGRAIVRALAAAPKDRSADHLICSAELRADWEPLREQAGKRSIAERVAMVSDANLSLAARVTAAWFASGIETGKQRRVGAGDLPGLMDAFAEMGLSQNLVDAVHTAAKMTKEPIVLMLPLLMQELSHCSRIAEPERIAVPAARYTLGIPLFALDKHTRVGRQAIAMFAHQNADVRESLERYVPDFRHREPAMLAAFYADAAPVAHRLNWQLSDELEVLGIETDLLGAGVPLGGIDDVLAAFRSNLESLNDIRSQLVEHGATKTEKRS